MLAYAPELAVLNEVKADYRGMRNKEKRTARMDSPFFPQSVQLTRNLNSALTLASYQVQSVS